MGHWQSSWADWLAYRFSLRRFESGYHLDYEGAVDAHSRSGCPGTAVVVEKVGGRGRFAAG